MNTILLYHMFKIKAQKNSRYCHFLVGPSNFVIFDTIEFILKTIAEIVFVIFHTTFLHVQPL